MPFTPADPWTLVAFVAILIGVVAAFQFGLKTVAARTQNLTDARRAVRRSAWGLALWLGMLSLVVSSGFLSEAPFPRALIFLGASNLAAVLLAFSPVGSQLAQGLSIGTLVAFQTFRLPLELVLHSWALGGTIPMSMTWDGQNFDIVSGIVALIAAPFVNNRRTLAWLVNILGFGLLLNVVRVAVMSSPFPFAWPLEPPLQLAFHLPYALIVPICVAGSLAGHLILTRRLLSR